MTVRVRRVEPSDYPLIQQWHNDPETGRLMDYEKPFSLAEIQQDEEQAAREGIPFIIEADGTPVGRTGINQIRNRDGVGSLYLLIGDPSARGRGYGKAACELLLAYGFDVLNLRMITLWTLADNVRAIRLYTSVGFRLDGTLRDRSVLAGRTIDRAHMSITSDEFRTR